MSPFSAEISLRKSLATIHPVNEPSNSNNGLDDITTLAAKNMQLERDLNTLKIQYAHAINVFDNIHAKINYLESELASTTIKP